VQPVQLSLIPDLVAPPPDTLIAELPEARVAEAVSLLATLIAKTANTSVLSIVGGREAGGE
jgi:hypothetical protein